METFESDTFKKLVSGPIAAFKQEKDAEKCVDKWIKHDQEHEIPGIRTNYKVQTIPLE